MELEPFMDKAVQHRCLQSQGQDLMTQRCFLVLYFEAPVLLETSRYGTRRMIRALPFTFWKSPRGLGGKARGSCKTTAERSIRKRLGTKPLALDVDQPIYHKSPQMEEHPL